MMTPNYGGLIRVDLDDKVLPEFLSRIPLNAGATSGGISEAVLRDMLFDFPEVLPIAAIDPAYEPVIPICKELALPAGYADALYINHLGRITLAEFKLWRNPQARREVIGQILDYAKDLASWSYEDLQRQVSLALGKSGNALYDPVHQLYPELSEADFVDNVTRHLRRGEFLLLILGDGIHEGTASIVDFVQSHSGLHFNLSMVEAALYRDAANSLIVHPRVLARTEIVRRFVIESGLPQDIPSVDAEDHEDTLSDRHEQNRRFWTAVVRDYSFADVTVPVPNATIDYLLTVPVRTVGSGDWGLSINGRLRPNAGELDCFVTDRIDQRVAVRILDELISSFEELQREMGKDLVRWNAPNGRPRIGFRQRRNLAFLAESEDSANFQDAVSWMREHLNRLVSTLHPRLQAMLADER